MERLIVALAFGAGVTGCHRAGEMRTVVSANGSATAHFVGRVPVGERGELPPLEFGVESLYFTFTGDDERKPFKPQGALYFTDWSFDVFSSDGRYAALLESHYGPVDVIETDRLGQFLEGKTVPFERLTAPARASAAAPVVDHLRWAGPREIEFWASCCGDSEVVRRRIGEPGAGRGSQ